MFCFKFISSLSSSLPPFLSCPCHSSLIFFHLPDRCVCVCFSVRARVCTCCLLLYMCVCFLLPAPLRKAKFVESPRIPQSELGSPTHTSTTAKNPDLDTYCPGKFFGQLNPHFVVLLYACLFPSVDAAERHRVSGDGEFFFFFFWLTTYSAGCVKHKNIAKVVNEIACWCQQCPFSLPPPPSVSLILPRWFLTLPPLLGRRASLGAVAVFC